MSLVLDVNGLSIRMAHSLRKTPTCEGRGGRLPSCRDPCSTHSHRGETDPVGPLEVRQHEDVKQLDDGGAGPECVEAFLQPASPEPTRRRLRPLSGWEGFARGTSFVLEHEEDR